MKINNCIDLYDYYIVNSIERRLRNDDIKNLKFIFSPSSLCFYYAKNKFGERIFPFYNIWREKAPSLTSDASSLINYSSTILNIENKAINVLLLLFSYQIDFFSDSMYDMNQVVFDYYKLKSSPYLDIDLTEVGLDIKYRCEIQIDEISTNNNIDNQFEKGRYFRYSYNIDLRLLLIRNVSMIKYEKINFRLIEDGYNLLKEMKYEIQR